MLGTSSKNIIPNGDESHGTIRKKSPNKQIPKSTASSPLKLWPFAFYPQLLNNPRLSSRVKEPTAQTPPITKNIRYPKWRNPEPYIQLIKVSTSILVTWNVWWPHSCLYNPSRYIFMWWCHVLWHRKSVRTKQSPVGTIVPSQISSLSTHIVRARIKKIDLV